MCNYKSLVQLRADVFEDGQQFRHRFSTKHRDAGGAEVGDAFEDGSSSKVTTGVENASFFVNPLHIDAQLFDEDIQFGVEVENQGDRSMILASDSSAIII